MKTLTLNETEEILQSIGVLFAHNTSDIVNKKHELSTLIIQDERLDIDEIIDFTSAAMSIGFRIIKKGGRVNRQTGSRGGTIKQALWVEFNWRKFTDGGFQTNVEISF